jgi:chromosome segregation ATPase
MTTSLKEKLEALNKEAEGIENSIKGVNNSHADMMSKLGQIENFVSDSKDSIEKEAKEAAEVQTSYEKLLKTIERVKLECVTLKKTNQELKDKINKIATICVFSGAVVALSLGLVWKFLSGLITKYKKNP